jgi:hypothetical protein
MQTWADTFTLLQRYYPSVLIFGSLGMPQLERG